MQSDSLRTFDTEIMAVSGFAQMKGHYEELWQTYKTSRESSAGLSFVRYALEKGPRLRKEFHEEPMGMAWEAEGLRCLKSLASGSFLRPPVPEAQFLLAQLIEEGRHGIKADKGKALGFYKQAAKQNHADACYHVGRAYELGEGTKKDEGKAARYYRNASLLGSPRGMHRLAVALLYGRLGQKANLKEGVAWLKRAAVNVDRRCPEVLHDLAKCYLKDGGCPALIPDNRYAFDLFRRAAEWDYAPSQVRLAGFYEHGLEGVIERPDRGEALRWYRRAARHGDARGHLALADECLAVSEGGHQEEAIPHVLEAIRCGGSPRAFFLLGYFNEHGVGGEVCLAEAIAYYQMAAERGYQPAKDRLKALRKAKPPRRRCTMM